MRQAKNSGYILLLPEEIEKEKQIAFEKGYEKAKKEFAGKEEVPEKVKKSKAKVKVSEDAAPLDLRMGIVEETAKDE